MMGCIIDLENEDEKEGWGEHLFWSDRIGLLFSLVKRR